MVGTAATVAALLAGPGRHAHVVLLDLDLGDGTTVEQNVAAILAAGPAVLVLSASDRPLAVRAAMRAGALGYVLKNEPTSQIRAAITEVAAGRDWISPRLAYIFATDDAPDRPALSEQERRALQLYATGMPMKSVARKMAISEETVKQYLQRVRQKYARAGYGPRQQNSSCIIEPSRTGTSHRLPKVAIPPLCGPGSQDVPVLGFSSLPGLIYFFQYRCVMTPIDGVMTKRTYSIPQRNRPGPGRGRPAFPGLPARRARPAVLPARPRAARARKRLRAGLSPEPAPRYAMPGAGSWWPGRRSLAGLIAGRRRAPFPRCPGAHSA